jgi:aspartate kinase
LRPSTAIALPVDVVSTSEVSVSLTVDSNESIPALAADLAKLADVKYEGRKAIVCVVGENVRNTPGIAARVFNEVKDVNIRMISQGASEINLTFVIEEDAVPQVIRSSCTRHFSRIWIPRCLRNRDRFESVEQRRTLR